MRKALISVLALCMVLTFFAGCSSSSDSDSKSDTATKNEQDSKNVASLDSDRTEAEITFLVSASWAKEMSETVKTFEKENPGIKVKVNSFPFRQLLETIEVQMNSKKPDFDVFVVDAPLVANYTVKGYLEPLDAIFDDAMKAKWIDSSVKAGTYDGKFMAPPLNTSANLLFYNKDIFQEKGVTPPSMDVNERWTWEKVVEAGKQLTYDTNGDGQTDVFGFTFDQIGRPYQILPLPQSLGAKVISDDGLVAKGYTNSAEMVQAAKFYQDMFNTWKISPKINADVSQEYFATGKVAMFVGETSMLSVLKERNVNFGVAPHPYFEGKQVATPTGSWHVGISKYTDKKEAAAKFVQWITHDEGSKLWFEMHNDISANVDVLNEITKDPKYDEFPLSAIKIAAYEAINTAVARPSSPGYLEWETLLGKAYDDIQNGADPQKALDQATEQIDRQLAKYSSLAK